MQYGQVLQHLLEACPSYDADVSMSEMTDSTADFYACLSGLAAHLIELHRLGQVETLRSAFRGVESVFETSDEWMTWKVYYGFLQELRDISSRQGIAPVDMQPYLGAKTAALWDRLESWWDIPPEDRYLIFDGYWLAVSERGPEREMQLNERGTPTYAAPTARNYGEFLDSDWTPKEFMDTVVGGSEKVTKELFEKKWSEYFRLHPDDSPLTD